MRAASIIAISAFSLAAFPAAAQVVIDETTAIQRALALDGIAARDEAERSGAVAEIDMIGPLDNPSVEISYEGSGGETEWQLGIVQPIDFSGQRESLRDAARAEAAAVDADIERRRQELVAEVRTAYVQCAAATGERDVLQRYTTELAEAERVSAARAEAGDTAVYDVRRVRVEQGSAEAKLARAVGERAAGCAALAALTGVESPQVELASITQLTAGPAAGERPDLLAQEQRILAATQRVTAARRARLPQIVPPGPFPDP
jgi:cobalt-zinc-cadmium efflux system outer membrane protein